MKKIIFTTFTVAVFVALSACTTVREKPTSHTTTTTTEQSSMQQPVSATSTTETRSIRSY